MKKWRKLDSQHLLRTQWCSIRKDIVELPTGDIMDDYYVIERPDVVLILPVKKNGNIILKKEYRYAVDSFLYELPGGTFSPADEDALHAAKREFLEETGCAAARWDLIGQFYDYPTKDVYTTHIFLARDVENVDLQNLDVSEDIMLVELDQAEVKKMVMQGEITVSSSVSGILKGLDILEMSS